MDNDYMTVAEAAKIAGVTTKSITRYLNAGHIRGVRPGGFGHWRVDRESFEAFMRGESAVAESEGDAQ